MVSCKLQYFLYNIDLKWNVNVIRDDTQMSIRWLIDIHVKCSWTFHHTLQTKYKSVGEYNRNEKTVCLIQIFPIFPNGGGVGRPLFSSNSPHSPDKWVRFERERKKKGKGSCTHMSKIFDILNISILFSQRRDLKRKFYGFVWNFLDYVSLYLARSTSWQKMYKGKPMILFISMYNVTVDP